MLHNELSQTTRRLAGWHRFEKAVRRLFDVVITAAAIALTLPLWIVIAVAIRLDSRGPALFGQWRVGRFGRPFRLWKFRTMVANAEQLGPKVTAAGDERRTRCGRWLRKWKLDELPQLWNVLRGEMSLVGPRPEVPEWAVHWPRETAPVILSVRPGITDPVTLQLRNEEQLLGAAADPAEFYRDVLLAQKADSYVAYIHCRSLRRDAMVLLRTPCEILRPAPTRD